MLSLRLLLSNHAVVRNEASSSIPSSSQLTTHKSCGPWPHSPSLASSLSLPPLQSKQLSALSRMPARAYQLVPLRLLLLPHNSFSTEQPESSNRPCHPCLKPPSFTHHRQGKIQTPLSRPIRTGFCQPQIASLSLLFRFQRHGLLPLPPNALRICFHISSTWKALYPELSSSITVSDKPSLAAPFALLHWYLFYFILFLFHRTYCHPKLPYFFCLLSYSLFPWEPEFLSDFSLL